MFLLNIKGVFGSTFSYILDGTDETDDFCI